MERPPAPTAPCVGLMRLSRVVRWSSQQPEIEGASTWFGSWQDTDSDGFHEFSGTDYNSIYLSAGETVVLQLRWSDSWLAASKDLDLYLVDSNFYTVKSSTLPQFGSSGRTPSEYLSFTAPYSGLYRLAVERYAGAPPAWLQVQAFSSQQLAVYTGRSIGNPAETANPGALAVGATNWATPTAIEYLQQHRADAGRPAKARACRCGQSRYVQHGGRWFRWNQPGESTRGRTCRARCGGAPVIHASPNHRLSEELR